MGTDGERLDKALDECQIPEHMREGVRNYVLRREPSGDFLMSVLENDFAKATGRADTTNRRNNTIICWSWLLHSGGIPNDAWGSKEKVDRWLAGTEGQLELQPRINLTYVYVVTVSARGADKGEFDGTPTAFEELISAQLAMRVCCEAIGGRFVEVDTADDDGDHIVERWDSDEFSVWLERLVFESAL